MFHPAIMTRAAVETFHVVNCADFRRACGHPETDVHMTESAGIVLPVNPMVEYHRRHSGLLGKIIDCRASVFVGESFPFLHPTLCPGDTSSHEDNQHHEKYFSHCCLQYSY